MENNHCIYKLTFSDGKTYIGQCKGKSEDRWKNGEGYKGQDVYVPIIKEGWNNVKKEILESDLTAAQANALEKHYIQKYKSCINGYNRTNGGGCKEPKFLDNWELHDKLLHNIIEKIPQLASQGEDGLLTLAEIQELSLKEPKKKLIFESEFFGPRLKEVKLLSDPIEFFPGGDCDQYLWQFLKKWRVWRGNTDVITLIKTPWLDPDEKINDYCAFYIKDKKIREYYNKNREFPSIQDRSIQKYLKETYGIRY